jgi:hypothetical protein
MAAGQGSETTTAVSERGSTEERGWRREEIGVNVILLKGNDTRPQTYPKRRKELYPEMNEQIDIKTEYRV